MTNRVLIKRSGTANSIPQAVDLQAGELAINYADGNLFYKNSSNTVTVIASNQFVNVSGNVTGNYFIGNGSQLTGIVASAGAAITNGNSNVTVGANGNVTVGVTGTSNVAVFTPTGLEVTSTITATGNVTGANLNTTGLSLSGNVLSAINTTSNITTTANVSANYYLGNGALLTGIITSVANINNGNSNVSIDSSAANVTVGVSGVGNVVVVAPTGQYVTGLISATGNITGANINGNGSGLSSLTGANVVGNVSNAVHAYFADVANSVSGSNVSGQVANALVAGTVYTAAQPNITSVGILTSVSVSGNVNGGNLITTAVSAVNVSVSGNVTGNYFIGNGSALSGNVPNSDTATTAYNANITTVSNNQEYRPLLATGSSGNLAIKASSGISWNPSTYGLTAGKILLGSGIGAQGVTGTFAFGANTGWAVQSMNGTSSDAAGQEIGRFGSEYTTGASTFWNAYTAYYQGSSSTNGWQVLYGGSTGIANITSTGMAVTGVISVSGNVTGGNLITAAAVNAASVSASGNVTGGNVIVGNLVFSTDTISSQDGTITIDPAAVGVTGLVVINGNLQVNGNTTTINSNVVSTNDLTLNLANNAINSAAASGGGIEVGPIGSPYITWLYNSTANTWETTRGISATGNITGGNLSGTSVAGTLTTAAQTNITSVGTLGSLAVTGNITGGNLNAAGLSLSSNVVSALNSTANITTTANISAGYFLGNGSQLTGIATGSSTKISNGTSEANIGTTNGNANITIGGTSNVAVFTTGGLNISGVVSATGNVTGGNITTNELFYNSRTIDASFTTPAGFNGLSAGTITVSDGVIGTVSNSTAWVIV